MKKIFFASLIIIYSANSYANNSSQKPDPNCVCTNQWQPVCGKDGKTYGNSCQANCANVQVAKPGTC